MQKAGFIVGSRRGCWTAVFAVLPTAFVSIGPIQAAAVSLPFHAVIQGNANPVFPANLCVPIANSEFGSGTAVHLGAIKWISTETAQFDSCTGGVPTSPNVTDHGSFTLVAANGDEIHGIYTTYGTLDLVNGVSVSGHYQFVSGTGRFANVTGGGTISAQGSAAPPFEFVGSMDGRINY